MTITRLCAAPAIAAITLLALAGCFGTAADNGGAPGGTTTDKIDLVGTTWSGTDSVGDFTVFEFEADGTVNVTYNEREFDESTDTWKLSGSALTVTVFLNDDLGNAIYTGDVTGATIDMNGAIASDGESWTVTLTQQ